MKKCLLLIHAAVLLIQPAKAQIKNDPDAAIKANLRLEALVRQSDSLLDAHDELINGKYYISEADLVANPFFIDNTWIPATLIFSDTLQTKNLIRYDLTTDNVILLVKMQDISVPVCISRHVLKEFRIYDHHFINLGEADIKGSISLIPGYYEAIYKGKTSLYARYEKRKAVDNSTLQKEFPLETRLFLEKGGDFFMIRNKPQFVKTLVDHKEEIKTFMRRHRLKFSPGKTEDAIKVLEYYDTL